MRRIDRVIIHHSASPISTRVGTIARWHREKAEQAGWRDRGIAYHYVITGDGKIHRTRPIHEVTNGARGSNRNSLHVCIVGDNTHPARRWRHEQLQGLQRLLLALYEVFGQQLEVLTHSQVTNTECPGRTLTGIWT